MAHGPSQRSHTKKPALTLSNATNYPSAAYKQSRNNQLAYDWHMRCVIALARASRKAVTETDRASF